MIPVVRTCRASTNRLRIQRVGASSGIFAMVLAFSAPAHAEDRWTLSPGSPGDLVRCDLSFADPHNPMKAFISVAQMKTKQLVFLVRQPDAEYPEFTSYLVTLRSTGETLTFPAVPISSKFLSTGLNETTDPNHRLVSFMIQSFDLSVTKAGKPYGPVEHVGPVSLVLGHQQGVCFRQTP